MCVIICDPKSNDRRLLEVVEKLPRSGNETTFTRAENYSAVGFVKRMKITYETGARVDLGRDVYVRRYIRVKRLLYSDDGGENLNNLAFECIRLSRKFSIRIPLSRRRRLDY